jgi:hypothetical protein
MIESGDLRNGNIIFDLSTVYSKLCSFALYGLLIPVHPLGIQTILSLEHAIVFRG